MYILYWNKTIATYRIQCRVNVAIGSIGQCGLLQIDLNMIGSRCGGAAALRFRCIEQYLERGDRMQLGRFLVHLAWNIIFVIVIVCISFCLELIFFIDLFID